MCQALQELDIQSRAAESIVDDWQGPIVEEAESELEPSQPTTPIVRLAWSIDQLVGLLLHGVDCAHRVREACAEINTAEAVEEGESAKVIAITQAGVTAVKRLIKATKIALCIVDMFKSQGLQIARADELENCPSVLTEIIDDVEGIAEDVGWQEINKQALPLNEFKEFSAYLIETGKASA